MISININEKRFNETVILKDLDFSLNKSEFISIIGPSGCGKSTLLNIISFLDNDYVGKIKGVFKYIFYVSRS